MNSKDKYYELCYSNRIHEFSKIDQYKKWSSGEAKSKYKSLDEFYMEEINISKEELLALRADFEEFNSLYSRYYNEQRQELFSNPTHFLQWYNEQNASCNYCGITQSNLLEIVEKREGNLTLNQKIERNTRNRKIKP
jgi:hypothetical protein